VVVDCDVVGQHWLTVTLEGLPEDVRAEADAITAALRQAGAVAIAESDATATARWCAHLRAAGEGDLLLRAGVPPQHLAFYWQMLPEDVRNAGAWFVDVASGLLFGRRPVADVDAARRWVESVQQPALALRGYAVVQTGPTPLLTDSARSEECTASIEVAAALKQRWDPAGVLI
jgi:D-lactate dehydrogenase (cytochrome)